MRKKKVFQGEQHKVPQEKIADLLKLPKDILLGASILTAMGNHELSIENYKGILEYQEDSILLQGKKYRIRIKGKQLQIACYTKEEIKICGNITEVNFQ